MASGNTAASQKDSIDRFAAVVTTASPAGTIRRITLLLLLLYGASSGALQTPMVAISGAMLVVPKLSATAAMWWLLVIIQIVDNSRLWYSIDNHKFLITYLTILVARISGDDELPQFATASRWLIVVVFTFAVVWKLYGHQYLDGRFMLGTMVLEPRLAGFAEFAAGVSTDELHAIGGNLTVAAEYGLIGAPLRFVEGDRILYLAQFMSWTAVIGETLVALLFALNLPWAYRARHVMLQMFILCTYVLLPVIGFALCLTVLGIGCCARRDRETRARYLFIAVLVFLVQGLVH